MKCPECEKIYNEFTCWPVCPHNLLKVASDLPYCRRHNLYKCALCPKILPARMSQQEWDDQFWGQVKIVGTKLAPDLLVAHQRFMRILEYHGRKYKVTAWTPPGEEPYVEAELIYDAKVDREERAGRA